MLSQFKNYTQIKKNPVLSTRPSVFCSPDGEDEDEELDYSQYLDMKGNLAPLLPVAVATAILVAFNLWWSSTHTLLKVSPPEDSDTRLIIEKMASFVAEGGPELERKARDDYKDNPVFT